ncbi:hypothetical protein Cgig2_032654 [Carnegiea gigantea]|uniref:Uncharacterized protein n=1 Tax=Carnegiea gigantea TaxID=171969 RepID=A0A9Q1JH63_9CARY|nr:hypothetical protein Cgig2_032654 [Carnegiea gigantea]
MVNNNSEPRRKRERSLSPSASTATATNITGANSSKNKLNTNRRSQPRKEKICKANTTRPMILPQRIRQKMRELGIDVDDKKSKPELILQKLVFKSDIDNQQARFLIPKGQLSTSDDDFLEHDEWRVLNEGTGKINVKVIQETMEVLNEGTGKIKVKVIQETMRVKDREMTLARWAKPKKKPRRSGGIQVVTRCKLSGIRGKERATSKKMMLFKYRHLENEKEIASLPKKLEKERSPRPSKEDISKAHTTVPPLPLEIHQKMAKLGIDEKSEPMLILQKLAFKIDVDNHQAQLLIPKGQLLESEDKFLENQELKKLNERDGEIKVMVIQRSMEAKDMEMTLALWP